MHLKSNEITTSDFLEIVISLSNTGKSSASLVKIEDIVSEKLQAAYVSSYYAFNERYIDLKGKKLGPLSTEEITIRLNPQSKGEYSIKPRVVYHDDTGEYKFCDVEAVDIKISDMGLSGWFRGPRVKPQKKDVK